MLLCNACVENNEHVNFIKGNAIASLNEILREKLSAKLVNIDVREKLKTKEQRLNDLFDEKIGYAMRKTCEKVAQTDSAVVAVDKSTGKFEKSMKPQMKAKLHDNPKLCLGIQGVKEDPAKSNDENFFSTTKKIEEVLKLIDMKPETTDFKRLGKIEKNMEKPRAVLVKLSIEFVARLVLARCRYKRETAKKALLCFQLCPKMKPLKNQALKKRRKLLNEGVSRKKIKTKKS